MYTPIDVDEDNQRKHDREFIQIIKNMYGTCFISNFKRNRLGMVSDMSEASQVMLIDVDNLNQAESHKWVRHILKNTYVTCFISNFSIEIDWERSQICQRPPSHAHRRRQPQPGRVPQLGTSYFRKHTYMTHILYPIIFQEKSIRKGLRYVRGLLVMLIDVDNVNQAESHKWVRHIL